MGSLWPWPASWRECVSSLAAVLHFAGGSRSPAKCRWRSRMEKTRTRLRGRLTYANVVSTLCLVRAARRHRSRGRRIAAGPEQRRLAPTSSTATSPQDDLAAERGRQRQAHRRPGQGPRPRRRRLEHQHDRRTAASGASTSEDSSLTGDDLENESLTGADVLANLSPVTTLEDGSLTGPDVANGSLAGADVQDRTLNRADYTSISGVTHTQQCERAGGRGERLHADQRQRARGERRRRRLGD